MTSPNVVDAVAVEILADARALAKSMKAEVEKAFKDLDPGKATEKAAKKRPVKVPLDVDADGLAEKVKKETSKARPPKVPVGLDPLLDAFQQDVQRQIRALARSVNTKIPVGADTDSLRRELGSELARVAQQAKARIPVEVAGREQYAADLRATVARATEQVRQATTRARIKVPVDVDVDRGGALAKIRNLFTGAGATSGGPTGVLAGLSNALERAGQSAVTMGGTLTGALSSATGPVGVIISLLTTAAGAMGALGAAAVLVVPAITAVAGAAAAIPGAIAGAAAAFGAIRLGFSGVGDAIGEVFNPKPSGGGGGGGGAAKKSASSARQVEAAKRGIAAANRQVEASERSLAAAQRGVVAAQERLSDAIRRELASQKAISRARDEARESIEDLNRSLRGAMLSEEDAALGVEEALRALNEAKLTGNIPDIKRADLAYRQSLQTLEEAQDTTGDLAKETEEANRKGVEGSDQVQRALEDQRDAARAVRDAQIGIIEAQDGLKSAQDGVKAAMDGAKSAADALKSAQESLATSSGGAAGGAAKIATAYDKLAPAAKKFVDAIRALKPQLESLQLEVQQRLFDGLAKTITDVARAWDRPLRSILGSYADTFNQFFKDLGKSVTDGEFISDLQTGIEGFREGMEALLDSIAQRLVPALGDLVEASGPFLEELGKGLGRMVDRFSAWIQSAEQSGALTTFFDKAVAALKDIGKFGGSVLKFIGSFIGAITGAQAVEGESPLDKFSRGLDKVSDWLNDPANQEKIKTTIDDLANMAVEFGRTAESINKFLEDIGVGGNEKGAGVGESIGRALISGLLAGLWGAYKESMEVFLDYIFLGGVIGFVKKIFGIQSPSTVFADIGRDLIRGLIGGIAGWLGNLKNAAIRVKNTVVNALSNAASWLTQTGRNVVSGLGSGMAALGGWLRDRALNLKSWVTNTLSNAGNWLVNTGKNVVYGLWNGIAGLGGWLWNKVQTFARDYVSRAIQNALGINSPSKVAAKLGRGVPEGLALGIDKDAGLVASAAERLAAAALPQIQDTTLGLGWEADAAIRGSLAVADQRDMMLSWKTGTTGDQLLDAIAKVVDVRFNSNVQAAFTRTRR